jgi:DNA-binding transcriptional ArsR family regulator
MNSAPVTERNVLRAYLEANRRVQATQNDGGQIMPIAILNTFLGAAIWGYEKGDLSEPATLEHLAERLGITPTTLSTHMRYLGDKYREGKEGLGLVEMDIYPLNRRQKIFRLTPKGKALAAQLAYILEGARPVS